MIAQRVLINVVETVAMNGLQYWRKKNPGTEEEALAMNYAISDCHF